MFTESQLALLRKKVKSRLSDERYRHTLGVEKCAVYLAELCLPGFENEIAAAAILHDVTKELSVDEQLLIIQKAGILLSEDEKSSPQIFHSFTAPYVILKDFSDFATENVLSAVRRHTTGDVDMSVFDLIIFLSDFIEENRTYKSCVELRDFVFSNIKPNDINGNIKLLSIASLREIDITISNLISKNRVITNKTIFLRNRLLTNNLQI